MLIEDIYKSNNNATNSVISYLFFPRLHESKHYNLHYFQIKSASRCIIVLMIMATLMKVRRKALSFAWLPFTLRYQNTSAEPLILLNFYLFSRNGGLETMLLNWNLTCLA